MTIAYGARETNDLLARFLESFERRFGYPPGAGENWISGPAASQDIQAWRSNGVVDVRRADILEFFGEVSEVSLPDVSNGYLIGPPSGVLADLGGDGPAQVVGSLQADVLPIGSDGGGGRVAVDLGAKGSVYVLRGGALRDRVYDVDWPIEIVAANFDSYLASITNTLLAELG